ncbi:MAG: hypothetical protein IJ718_02640 [Paludibacteraceae bacterium]|jgi:hypothetical protein|nr:hypothetical protein [Paludibacteraceae bacterium]
MHRFDKYWIGVLIGLLFPAIFGYAYLESLHLWQALSSLGDLAQGIISKLLIVCVFPDLALIFLFYTTDTWKLSKGILIGSFPYILAALIISM